MTTNELTRPQPLAAFLDRGGDPRVELGDYFDLLVEHVWLQAAFTAEEKARDARLARTIVDATLRGDWPPAPMPQTREQSYLTLQSWEGDVLADPEGLGPRVLAFLDHDDRVKAERRIWMESHPHPLRVERQQSDTLCSACGDAFPAGDLAMTVGHQVEHDGSEWTDPVDGRWCYGCVTIAVEALRAARGS